MQRKTSVLIIVLILQIFIIIIAFSEDIGNIDTEIEQDKKSNLLQDFKDKGIPIYENYSSIENIETEFLWEGLNISAELDKIHFFTLDSINSVVNWYEDEENLDFDRWALNRTKIRSSIEDPYNVSYGQVFLKNETNDSIFIVCRSIDENQEINANTICGIAVGKWDLIKLCGEE
jgi:hypothetical protein